MSSVAKGASRVASIERQLAAIGYRYVRSSASGRAGSEDRRASRIPGDLIAFAPAESALPHVLVEVGGVGKRIGVAIAELTEKPLPGGFIPLVATCVRRQWRFYLDADERFDTISDALEHARTV